MDRRPRRFVPSPEGLEGRTLLSTAGGRVRAPRAPRDSSSQTSQAAATQAPRAAATQAPRVSATFDQKTQRIDRLPRFLQLIEPRRSLPDDVIARLQEDLREIEGRLHNAAEPVVRAFNLELRRVGANASLSPRDAQALNQAFGRVLESAGATPQAIAALQADLNDLAAANTHDVTPIALTTNDYALILQTALGVGRPIRRPAAPRLDSSDNTGRKTDQVTSVRQPHILGTYDPGATIEVLDETGAVIGSGVVGTTGRYSAAITNPLSDGTHTLQVRATVAERFSAPSAPLTLIINAPTPRGPLARRPPRD